MKPLMAICLAATAAFALAAVPAVDTSTVTREVDKMLATGKIPGVAVAVLVDGNIVFERGYGIRDVQTNSPITPDTRFEIGSVTKQFTAAAILQLKERGKLRLTDRLGMYVPEYAPGKDVTIEQLLWQVTGIPDCINDVPNIKAFAMKHLDGGLSWELAAIHGMPLYFTPGTQWRYSNTNYVLLGAIVERVSHMSWEHYVRTNIFERAGMRQSAFLSDEAKLPDHARGYAEENNVLTPQPIIPDGWAGPAGAIVSTVGDLAKWDDAFFSGKIVDAADVALATTPHMLPSGTSTHYGFGWIIDTLDGIPRMWHGGDTLGFQAANEYFPSLHETVITLSNKEGNSDLTQSTVFEALNPKLAREAHAALPGEDAQATAIAAQFVRSLQSGDVDRSQLTPAYSEHLTPARIETAKAALAPLGNLKLIFRGKTTMAGITAYEYQLRFTTMTLNLHIQLDSSGKIAKARIDSQS